MDAPAVDQVGVVGAEDDVDAGLGQSPVTDLARVDKVGVLLAFGDGAEEPAVFLLLVVTGFRIERELVRACAAAREKRDTTTQ